MDVDDDGTPRPLAVDNFGIEVDFDGLEDEEREVCFEPVASGHN